MDNRTVSRQLKADFQIALDIGLADKIHQADLFPSGADATLNDGRNRQLAGHVRGQKSGAALSVIAGLDVVGKSLDVLLAGAYFFKSHFFSLLYSNFFNGFALALCDSVADLRPLGLGVLAVLKLFVDAPRLGLKCVKVCFRRVNLCADGTSALKQFLNGHVFEIHQSTSVIILIFFFLRSISLSLARSLSSDAFALSSASARPLTWIEV